MLIKSLIGVTGAVALSLLSACSTPCDVDGKLCAPQQANTSTGDHPLARQAGAVPAGQPTRAATPAMAALPGAKVETMPIDTPGAAIAPAAGREPIRIGLLLPLRSDALGPPAQALRAGFMAAHERDREGFSVNVIETGDSPQENLDAYSAAVERHDIMVGPLARSAVGVLAASGAVSKPTVALNHPDMRGADVRMPAQMLIMGLSIEDEARQVAQWAASEQRGDSALIVSGNSAWQRRLATAFATRWKQLGKQSQTVELTNSNGYLSESGINQLKTLVDTEPPTMMFAALDAEQLRQVRSVLGTDLPVYGTSSTNPGTEAGSARPELDGVRLLDLPWEVQPDHPAVMVYPRWTGTPRTLDLDRLYALGIDAYRVAREMALRPGMPFKMDGVTGKLAVSFGANGTKFERVHPTAVYQGGAFKPAASKR